MTDYLVKRSALQGEVSVPTSKSHSIRAIVFASLADGTSFVRNPLDSPDIEATVRACQAIGAKITRQVDGYRIQGVSGKPSTPADVIDAGNSGQVLRFVGALAALSEGYTIITGDESIRSQRPVQPLLEGLRGLKAFAESSRQNGLAPIIVRGPLRPGRTRLTGEDSQPVSGLLMAAACLPGVTEIEVENAGEIPWISLTLDWLDRLGVRYERQGYTHYKVFGATPPWKAFDYTVPGDFSSAAFPIAAALITQSEVTLSNLDMNDIQGDKQIIAVLNQLGADIEVDTAARRLVVKKGARLRGAAIDLNNIIDAIAVLAVVGCFAEGETRLFNGAIARTKECDRISCMARELRHMGASIEETPDGLIIRRSNLKGAVVESHGDHRVAMSLAVAGMASEGSTHIKDVDCVAKSYRPFADHFRQLGANLKEATER